MIDLNEMMVFAHVAREGSFTAAARSLGIPKSTVSRRVVSLEERLGARLLHRTTRKINLTEAGAVYYERCRQILTDVLEADRHVAHLQEEPRGLLRLSAPTLVGEAFLTRIVLQYMERFPEVSVDMVLGGNLVDLVTEGFDLAVRVGELQDSSLVVRKLGQVSSYLCATPEYLEEHGYPEHPSDLQKHACIVFGADRVGATWSFIKDRNTLSVPVTSRLMVNSMAAARDAALASMGIARLPAFLCADLVREGKLRVVLCGWNKGGVAIQAVYPSRRHLSCKVRSFLDFLVQETSPPPWEVNNLPLCSSRDKTCNEFSP